MKIRTAELEDAALDWAVGVATKEPDLQLNPNCRPSVARGLIRYQPSTDWSQGGPLLDEYAAALIPQMGGGWTAEIDTPTGGGDYYTHEQHGDTALVAVCRAIVAATFGATVPAQEES